MNTIIIENALPIMLANAVVAEFPDENWRYWHKYNDENSLKYATKDHCRIPEACKRALHRLGNIIENEFIDVDFFVDYDFHGAGMHMIPSGGYLTEHVDAEYHPIMPWKRRLSACWYATPGWDDKWGGEIQIEGLSTKPEFNSLLIFESNLRHEVLPVTGPENRKVLSLFCWERENNPVGNTQANFNTT